MPPHRHPYGCALRPMPGIREDRPLRMGLLLLLAALLAACSASDGVVQPATVEDGLSLPGSPLLLDVRTPEEFAEGFVPGAINIPLAELGERMVEIEAYAERGIVAYCESGGRAERAIRVLSEAGFQNLAILDGSMRRWRAEQRPVARPASALGTWPGRLGEAARAATERDSS